MFSLVVFQRPGADYGWIMEHSIVTIFTVCVCVCYRVSSTPVECSKWELSAELGEESYSMEVTKSENTFTVSIC